MLNFSKKIRFEMTIGELLVIQALVKIGQSFVMSKKLKQEQVPAIFSPGSMLQLAEEVVFSVAGQYVQSAPVKLDKIVDDVTPKVEEYAKTLH